MEQLFRTLKTQGFDIEGLRRRTRRRGNLVMAAFVAAVVVQQLVHARDGARPVSPCVPLKTPSSRSDRLLLEAFCGKLEGNTAVEEPASQRLTGLCRLGLRSPPRVDWRLRQARPDGQA